MICSPKQPNQKFSIGAVTASSRCKLGKVLMVKDSSIEKGSTRRFRSRACHNGDRSHHRPSRVVCLSVFAVRWSSHDCSEYETCVGGLGRRSSKRGVAYCFGQSCQQRGKEFRTPFSSPVVRGVGQGLSSTRPEVLLERL